MAMAAAAIHVPVMYPLHLVQRNLCGGKDLEGP